MRIRSQDRKIIGEYISLSISEELFTKKCHISGVQISGGFFGNKDVILGTYDSLEKAMEILEQFQTSISKDPNGVYQIE